MAVFQTGDFVVDGGLLFLNGLNQSFRTPEVTAMSMPSFSPPPPPPLSSVSVMAEKQTLEMDQYVRLQSNRLRAAVQQLHRNHVNSLLRAIEWKASVALRAKGEELAMAKQKGLELEECMKRVERERDAWKEAATRSEAAAVTLNNTLEKMRETCASTMGGGEDDKVSCSGPVVKDEGLRRPCRWCGARESCVVLLPCRHLCACQSCEAILEACPVCRSFKRGSTEVFLA